MEFLAPRRILDAYGVSHHSQPVAKDSPNLICCGFLQVHLRKTHRHVQIDGVWEGEYRLEKRPELHFHRRIPEAEAVGEYLFSDRLPARAPHELQERARQDWILMARAHQTPTGEKRRLAFPKRKALISRRRLSKEVLERGNRHRHLLVLLQLLQQLLCFVQGDPERARADNFPNQPATTTADPGEVAILTDHRHKAFPENAKVQPQQADQQPLRKWRRAPKQALQTNRRVCRVFGVDVVQIRIAREGVVVMSLEMAGPNDGFFGVRAPGQRVDRRMKLNRLRMQGPDPDGLQIRVVDDHRVGHWRSRKPVLRHHCVLEPLAALERIEPPISVVVRGSGQDFKSGNGSVTPGILLNPRGRNDKTLHHDHPVINSVRNRLRSLAGARRKLDGH